MAAQRLLKPKAPRIPAGASFCFAAPRRASCDVRPRLADRHSTKDAIALNIQKPKNAVHAALSPNPQIRPVIRTTEDIDPHSSSRPATTPLALFSSTHCCGGPAFARGWALTPASLLHSSKPSIAPCWSAGNTSTKVIATGVAPSRSNAKIAAGMSLIPKEVVDRISAGENALRALRE